MHAWRTKHQLAIHDTLFKDHLPLHTLGFAGDSPGCLLLGRTAVFEHHAILSLHDPHGHSPSTLVLGPRALALSLAARPSVKTIIIIITTMKTRLMLVATESNGSVWACERETHNSLRHLVLASLY